MPPAAALGALDRMPVPLRERVRSPWVPVNVARGGDSSEDRDSGTAGFPLLRIQRARPWVWLPEPLASQLPLPLPDLCSIPSRERR
jgi:hypothetical protein